MFNGKIMHATLVAIGSTGILLKGKSGSGKSDLALRLIEEKSAKLVADDAVELYKTDGEIFGKAPENLAGLLEVRGIGIVKYPYLDKVKVDLVIELKDSPDEIERMPVMQKDLILGLEINKIDLYAKENSAPDKIFAALRMLEQNLAN